MYHLHRNVTEQTYDILDAEGRYIESHDLNAAGYQRAYARVNALNYRQAEEAAELALEERAAAADSVAALAELRAEWGKAA